MIRPTSQARQTWLLTTDRHPSIISTQCGQSEHSLSGLFHSIDQRFSFSDTLPLFNRSPCHSSTPFIFRQTAPVLLSSPSTIPTQFPADGCSLLNIRLVQFPDTLHFDTLHFWGKSDLAQSAAPCLEFSS